MNLDKRRIFTQSQKSILYARYNGKCAICGQNLGDDWEADHIRPWSQEGKTILDNGQPTCKQCNRKKGNQSLRKWQSHFLNNYFMEMLKHYLLVATPAAGKTVATLAVIKRLLQDGIIQRLIVICPTTSLKKQWALSALNFGINLDPGWNSKGVKSGFDGICLTYAKIDTNIEILTYITNEVSSLVVLDEIHHAGESLTWGDSVRQTFSCAKKIIALSGTPFRGDNNQIPFVEYDSTGKAKSNFYFSYGDAIRDGVCRKTLFPALDGKAEYYYNGKINYFSSFNEVETDEESAQLLRALLTDNDASFLMGILKQADKSIDEFKDIEGHNSAGLIVCIDISHAKNIAKLVKKVTGHTPVIATSDDDESDDKIENFKLSGNRWIVAVKKISEGVDIPRLRVGVYLSNILTERTFRQFSGRFWRKESKNSDDEWCVIYAPRVPKLVGYMERIREEIVHTIEQEEEEIWCEWNEWDNPSPSRNNDIFQSLSSGRNKDGDIVVSNEQIYNYIEASEARKVFTDFGVSVNEWQAAEIINVLTSAIKEKVDKFPNETPETKETPLWERIEKCQKICNKLVNSLAYKIRSNGYSFVEMGKMISTIHGIWKNKPGNCSQSEAGVDELMEKRFWLESGQAENEVMISIR